MPEPKLNLTNEDLLKNLEEKSGIFLKTEAESYVKLHPVGPDEPALPEPAKMVNLAENFKHLVKTKCFDENLNTGLYIRLKELKEIIAEFELEHGGIEANKLTHVQVTFGFRQAKRDPEGNELDWNCLHLIMQGAIPVPEFEAAANIDQQLIGKDPLRVSANMYSTYDGDESNYVGPKLGIPPFGPNGAAPPATA